MTDTDTTADIPAIVDRAVRASTRWASADLATRARWLRALADAVDTHAAELVEIADGETRLGPPRLVGELARTTAQLHKFAAVVEEGSFLEATIDHADPADTPPRPDLRRVLVPLGPVAVWSASNFPFAFSVLGGDTASALAAGNAVVVKAHDGHIQLSERIAAIAVPALRAAGAPNDSIQLIRSRAEGVALIQHPAIAAGAFTGSIPGGRALYDLAAARPVPIPFYGELGSLNPVVITERAIAERGDELAAGLATSFTMGAGQFCTKPGVVLVPAGSGFAEAVGGLVADSTPALMLNDDIRSSYGNLARSLSFHPAIEVIAGKSPDDADAVTPLVLRTNAAAIVAESAALLEEVFGPATLVVEYRSVEEINRALTSVPGSLTGTIHSGEGEDIGGILRTLTPRVGRVLFEGWPTGVAVSWAQHHGGPYPATTSVFTSVGATAIRRFLRRLAYQSAPQSVLPLALRDGNPLGIPRRVDGVLATT